MPRQLIFTSVPRGLTPGQSGYCTVARSRDLREALIPRLEKLSYYTPESDRNPVICAHRVLDIRGTKFHVLTRIVDSGLDFTKRRRFIAHHLIFEPVELRSAAPPAKIFLEWKGWLENWEGDPQWLEDNRPIPESIAPQADFIPPSAWVTGGEADRENFLPFLAERGVAWDITFTNCFQPNDHSADFQIKATWPGTPGYEVAQRQDADFVPLPDLHLVPKPAEAPGKVSSTQPPESPEPVTASPASRSQSTILFWVAALLLPIAFGAALFFRNNSNPSQPLPSPADTPPPPPAQKPDEKPVVDVLLPDRPTWLAIVNQNGEANLDSIPPLAKLMQQLAANEIFTKDLSCTIQTNIHALPIPAALFADPQDHLVRFSASNSASVDLSVSKTALLKSKLTNAFAIEISDGFRILAIANPIILARDYLVVTTNIELQPSFEERLHRVELPKGSQLALRPLVLAKDQWIDPLADLEKDFALVPSKVFDLIAVQRHVNEVIADKEAKFRADEDEQAKLTTEQKRLLTDPKTPEDLKGKERLKALQRSVPKAAHELKALRRKAEAVPKDLAQIDRFALFLCLSNVNTELIRFVDKP